MATVTNEELLRSMLDATEGCDLKSVYGDDAEWAALRARLEPIVAPDCLFSWIAPGTRVDRRGLDEFREQWLEWMEAWDEYRSETESLRALDDERVLVLVCQTGRLSGGGEIVMKAAGLATVRDGRVCAVEFHANREDVPQE